MLRCFSKFDNPVQNFFYWPTTVHWPLYNCVDFPASNGLRGVTTFYAVIFR